MARKQTIAKMIEALDAGTLTALQRQVATQKLERLEPVYEEAVAALKEVQLALAQYSRKTPGGTKKPVPGTQHLREPLLRRLERASARVLSLKQNRKHLRRIVHSDLTRCPTCHRAEYVELERRNKELRERNEQLSELAEKGARAELYEARLAEMHKRLEVLERENRILTDGRRDSERLGRARRTFAIYESRTGPCESPEQ